MGRVDTMVITLESSGTTKEMKRSDIVSFLESADRLFPIPLSEKVDISEYADKLMNKATLVIYQVRGVLMGMAAGYTEHLPSSNLAYLALVGVLPECWRCGIGSALIQRFIAVAQQAGARGVHLYTDPSNGSAIAMYQKLGFQQVNTPDDPRWHDVHFQLLFE